MNTHTPPYTSEHLQKTESADLYIDEVMISASMSASTSLATDERTTLLNSRINLEKYEH